jgi:hypothetical protein
MRQDLGITHPSPRTPRSARTPRTPHSVQTTAQSQCNTPNNTNTPRRSSRKKAQTDRTEMGKNTHNGIGEVQSHTGCDTQSQLCVFAYVCTLRIGWTDPHTQDTMLLIAGRNKDSRQPNLADTTLPDVYSDDFNCVNEDRTSNHVSKYMTRTAGVQVAMRPCGVIIGFSEMIKCESPTQIALWLNYEFMRTAETRLVVPKVKLLHNTLRDKRTTKATLGATRKQTHTNTHSSKCTHMHLPRRCGCTIVHASCIR